MKKLVFCMVIILALPVLGGILGCSSSTNTMTTISNTSPNADELNDRGNSLAIKGEYDEAILEYNKAIELDPKFAIAYYNRGLAYLNKGQYDQYVLAIADFSKAIELDPKDASAYANRGLIYYYKGQYDLAIDDYSMALELDPKDASAYANRGAAYADMGLSDLAIVDFNKAIELSTDAAVTMYARKMLDSLTQTSSTTSILTSGLIYTDPVVYHVTRTLTITNTDAQVDWVNVWIPAVVAWDSQTNITSIATTPEPGNVWTDAQYGNSGLYWKLYNEPVQGSSVTINDEFVYTCYQVSCVVDPDKIGVYDEKSNDYQLFINPERHVESDDARIIEIAGQLQQGKTNPYDIAGAIYDWVMEHMTYYIPAQGSGGAKFALENGYGQCSDYASLFVALCRAAGIPARQVVGRWATSSPGGWHVWAEFYLPGYGWLPVDADVADENGMGRAYFGNLDNRRLIFTKGYRIVLQPSPVFFSPQCVFFQTWVGEWGGSGNQVQIDITYTIDPQP